MNLFKRIWKWFYQNVQILNSVLLIIIISQFITYLDIKLLNTSIVPIAYLVSIILLFLTFKESQKSNKMELGRSMFNNHIDRINTLKGSINYDKIFNSESVDLSGFSIKKKPEEFYLINFIYNSASVRIQLDNIDYVDYLFRMNSKDISLYKCISITFLKINQQCKSLKLFLNDIEDVANQFVPLYESLYRDKDFMSEDQIKLISRQIDDHLRGYYNLGEIIKEGVNTLNPTYIVDEKETHKFFSLLYPENFSEAYQQIMEIRRKLPI